VICHQRPGIAATAGQGQTVDQAMQKCISVGIVTEDILSVQASRNDMMDRSGDIYSSVSQHRLSLAAQKEYAN